MSSLLKFKCVKCGRTFEYDPRLATIMMLCDDCKNNKPDIDWPPDLAEIFGLNGKEPA